MLTFGLGEFYKPLSKKANPRFHSGFKLSQAENTSTYRNFTYSVFNQRDRERNRENTFRNRLTFSAYSFRKQMNVSFKKEGGDGLGEVLRRLDSY